MACTALASLLYTATIELTKRATDAITTISAAEGNGALTPDRRTELIYDQVHSLGIACLIVVFIFSIRYFLVRGQIYFLAEASNKLSADLRKRLFGKLLRLPVSYFNDRRSGAIQSVLTNDVNVYQNAIGIIRDTIDGPIKMVGAFIWITFREPGLAILAFALLPIMAGIISRNSKRMRTAQAQVQEDLADLSATTHEVLQGTRVVKAFGVETQTEGQYGKLIEQTYRSQMRAINVFAALRPLVEMIGAFALAAVLFVGGLLAAKGRLNGGDIVAMALAMDLINQGFRNFASLSNTSASVTAASSRIYGEVLDVPEETSPQDNPRSLPNPVGNIEFRNVSFTYPDGTAALEKVSFTLEAGTSLALVGPSGAGKSTIADLLLRFYDPTEGQILIDGVDTRELGIGYVRSLIGVVPQHTFLFAGTIEDNVRIGREHATQDEVDDALQAAHATEFAKEMSGRTTTELGERGVRLSGGQMQRVAIARALIRKPTVLLLDEATSALDATSERAVSEALDEIMRERTTLMIAHRLTTAARAQKLLYLKAGRVVEYGSHRELMEKDGEYAALFRVFSGGVLEDALF